LQSRGNQSIDPAQFVGSGHGLLDRLEAIARADFTDQYTVWWHVVLEVWQCGGFKVEQYFDQFCRI
jgi:hypothetical protein